MVAAFSIRRKITLCFIGVVLVMSSLFALISYLRIIAAMHVEIEKHGIEVVEILSQTTAPYVFDSDYVTVMDIADRLTADSEIETFSIIDPVGKVWMSTSPEQETLFTSDGFYSSIFQDKQLHLRQIQRNGHNVMEFVSPITALGNVAYLLRIEVSLERIEQEAVLRIRENIAMALAMVTIAIVLSVYLAKQLTAPLIELVKGTNELSQGNLSHRISVNASDETGLLSNSFNFMATNLENELSVRKEAERKLQEHTDRLEEMVSDRTALLTKINTTLSAEIEQHRNTQVALTEAKERYRRFSEVTQDGIVFFNEEGIIDINTAFTDMFGYTLETLVGNDLLERICLPEDINTIRNKLSDDSAPNVETTGRTKAGQTLTIELQRLSVKSNDTFLSVFFIRDISKRKQLESQLHQAQRMEGIGRLAAGIAHDLNNILSGIVTLPQLLMMDLPEESPLKGPLQLIQKSGDSAAVIVQDMLTLANSGLNIGKVINPRDLIMGYILSPESMKLKQTHPGVKIRLSIGEDVRNIKGSPVHLTKLLMNLVHNAADAIEGEGEILVTLKCVYLDKPLGNYEDVSQGEYMCLSVKDSGTGIPTQDLSLIFEPFYTKKVLGRSGTGLGMAIVWNTVKDHHGYIDIRSSLGIGTEVNVYLPTTRDALQQAEHEPGLMSLRGSQETILIVDDIEEQRRIASTILEKLNYQTRSVTGGEEAVAFLQGQPVDLILLDMIMEPGIDGLETCKRVFALYPEAKVIIASGYAESEMVSEALELGALKYIKKPYSITTLGSGIKNALS